MSLSSILRLIRTALATRGEFLAVLPIFRLLARSGIWFLAFRAGVVYDRFGLLGRFECFLGSLVSDIVFGRLGNDQIQDDGAQRRNNDGGVAEQLANHNGTPSPVSAPFVMATPMPSASDKPAIVDLRGPKPP